MGTTLNACIGILGGWRSSRTRHTFWVGLSVCLLGSWVRMALSDKDSSSYNAIPHVYCKLKIYGHRASILKNRDYFRTLNCRHVSMLWRDKTQTWSNASHVDTTSIQFTRYALYRLVNHLAKACRPLTRKELPHPSSSHSQPTCQYLLSPHNVHHQSLIPRKS